MPRIGETKVKRTINLADYGITAANSTTAAIDLADLGISLLDGAVTALLAPAPAKSYVTNKSRQEHGSRIEAGNARMDERQVTLPFVLTASGITEFYKRYDAFCDILANGEILLWNKHIPAKSFRLLYVSCNQFTQIGAYSGNDGGIAAKFTLRCTEPNPSDRSADRAIFPHLMLDRDELDDQNSQLT